VLTTERGFQRADGWERGLNEHTIETSRIMDVVWSSRVPMGKTREQAKVQACKLQVFAGKRRKYVQMSRHEREREREFQPGYSEFVAFF
jgi:hypothetical protein